MGSLNKIDRLSPGRRPLSEIITLQNYREVKQNLQYCRQCKTAKFAADAPKSSKASELLRAAIGGGFADNVATFADVVKRKKDGVQAANPYGCNQYGHKPGCEKYTGLMNKTELQHEQ